MSVNVKKRLFTDYELEQARQADLVLYLNSIGEPMKRRGNAHFWTGGGNETLVVGAPQPHMFFHNATERCGHALTFCQEYLGMGFRQAVESLIDITATVEYTAKRAQQKPISEKQPFVAPMKMKSPYHMRNYLFSRGLSASVISAFEEQGKLYQAKEQIRTRDGKLFEAISAGFLATDREGVPVGMVKRSLHNGPGKFSGNHPGSDMLKGAFCHEGNSNTLYVFEAPIDMLSFITMLEKVQSSIAEPNKDIDVADVLAIRRGWIGDSYLAISGTSNTSVAVDHIKHRLEKGHKYDKVWICLDRDVAGLSATLSTVEKLKDAGYAGEVFCYQPKGKDWNEDLMAAVDAVAKKQGSATVGDSLCWDSDFQREHLSGNFAHTTDAGIKKVYAEVIEQIHTALEVGEKKPSIPIRVREFLGIKEPARQQQTRQLQR